jgi:hypothetical protein
VSKQNLWHHPFFPHCPLPWRKSGSWQKEDTNRKNDFYKQPFTNGERVGKIKRDDVAGASEQDRSERTEGFRNRRA